MSTLAWAAITAVVLLVVAICVTVRPRGCPDCGWPADHAYSCPRMGNPPLPPSLAKVMQHCPDCGRDVALTPHTRGCTFRPRRRRRFYLQRAGNEVFFGWRGHVGAVSVAWGRVYISFTERNGYRPMPRRLRLGPIEFALHRRRS